MDQILKLKVLEAHEEYVGKNIVTLSIAIKQKLGIISGDIIEIDGEKVTAAQVWPEKDKSSEENIIRMDQYIRKNAGVSIGDFVSIKKINLNPAQQIILHPLKNIDFIYDNYDLIVKKNFLGRPFIENNRVMVNIFGTGYFFIVSSTTPKGIVTLSESTNFIINKKPLAKIDSKEIIGYEDVGGLKKEVDQVREMVEMPFKYPELFRKLNVTPPKGILLYGPPGTGKTLLAKALSNELKANFIALDAPQIMAKYVGEAEERLRRVFKKASQKMPSVIFIDEIDAIAPKRDSFVSEVEKRVVAQLLSLMDGISERGEIIVIGATNRLSDLDVALRRPGRFDREIEIGVPSEEDRLNILKIHTRNVPLEKDVSLKDIAKKTYGFVGADLSALIKEAAIYSIKNAIKKIGSNKKIPAKILENLKISKKDIEAVLKKVQPSALREVLVETPDITLKEVGALKEQKKLIEDIINFSLKKKELLSKMNLRPLKKILFYGPPGTGKTMFVKACAGTYNLNFIYVKGPEMLDKWLGESERSIRKIFKKAKDVAPCILFFDEIDSLTMGKQGYENQPKVLDQLLTELDNISNKDIIFIAATNRPNLIDKSFLRSGRIDKIVEFGLPDKKSRKEILELLLSKVPHTKLNLKDIVERTEGFTGADLDLFITDATLLAVRENKYKPTKLTQDYLLKVLKKLKPKISKEQKEMYDSFKSDTWGAKYIQ